MFYFKPPVFSYSEVGTYAFYIPSFPATLDYDGLEQNTDSHNILEINLNVSALLLS